MAAHLQDLEAAKSFGLKTIYVKRPGEGGNMTTKDEAYVDLVAENFIDAARKLGIKE